jgi:hypothetical protein
MKYEMGNLLEIEQFAAIGLSLSDSIMCVSKCSPDEASKLAKEQQIVAAHARGQAEGARNILASMTKLAATGNAGAAKLVLAAQRQAGALQDDIAAADRWAVEGEVNVGPSVRAGFAEQRRLIERMFAEKKSHGVDYE